MAIYLKESFRLDFPHHFYFKHIGQFGATSLFTVRKTFFFFKPGVISGRKQFHLNI